MPIVSIVPGGSSALEDEITSSHSRPLARFVSDQHQKVLTTMSVMHVIHCIVVLRESGGVDKELVRQKEEEDLEEEESLSIINESDFSPIARSFLSQLTTPRFQRVGLCLDSGALMPDHMTTDQIHPPRATPLLSPETLSPRSSWSEGPPIQ